ncbi:conserved membrane protein, unknown function [Hepatocystis sp. ex Piliocolobus tephrosceles]|nr:conserved membrane protein, unknown function [Hepatocystis sp. ex Piliocolobus tephrosceles]
MFLDYTNNTYELKNEYIQNADLLILNELKITYLKIFNDIRKEGVLTIKKLTGEETKKKEYTNVTNQIDSHMVINIDCTFKIKNENKKKKNFDKNKWVILLIKELEEKTSGHQTNNIKELQTTETFLFTYKYKNDSLISAQLSLLVINFIPFNGFYKFYALIADDNNNNYNNNNSFLFIPLIKVYIYFFNHIQITPYSVKEEEHISRNNSTHGIILTQFIRKKILKQNYVLKLNNVIDSYKEYYPLVITEKQNNTLDQKLKKKKNDNTSFISLIIVLIEGVKQKLIIPKNSYFTKNFKIIYIAQT